MTTMALPVGSRLGDYEIIATLGQGGMGVVYRAYDPQLQRTVAIKVLSGTTDEASRLRLLAEARAASALNHPHLCMIHEVGESGGQAFIVMEYVDGRPLSEMIPHDGLPIDSVIRYGQQIADAVAHAHQRGILHRDLKSSNVIVSRDGRAKLVDFGLAVRVAPASDVVATVTGSALEPGPVGGTLGYLAPEVLRGEAPTVASDIWGLGVLLYEMSSGHLPFSGRTVFDLTAAIIRGAAPSLPPHVPASVRMIISRCLSSQPAERYHTAGEVQASFQAVQSDVRSAPLSNAPPRAVAPYLAAGAALLVLGIVIVFLVMMKREDRPFQSTIPEQGRLALVVSSTRPTFDPALSPDGKMIAFITEDSVGRPDLYAGRVAGGDRLQLTNDEGSEGHPRFSPDGERILFNRRHPQTGESSLCVVPTLGGATSVLLTGASQGVWSPDGSRVAFVQVSAPGNPIALSTMRTDGSDLRRLVAADAAYPFLRSPAWSPDGRMLALVRGSGGVAAEIWLVPVDGTGLRRLSNDPPTVFSDEPVFTPDGRAVLHSSNRGGATNIWGLPINGGPAVRVTTGAGADVSPTVSQAGAIVFANSRWRNDLITVDLRTGQARTLATHAPYLWAPTFSPDAREVTYSRSEVDGSWHIWVVGLDGAPPLRVSSGPLGEVYSRYTPDGQSLIYHTWGTPRRIWRMPRQGGPAVALTPPELDASFADISPNGATLAFVVTEDKRVERVYLLGMDDRAAQPRLLTKSPASVPRWSPDGNWIAFAQDRGYANGVFVIHADGTGERHITQTGGWPVWWPDAQRLAYTTIAPDGKQEIRTIRLDGAASTDSIPFRFHGFNHPFDFSRDGRTLTTSDTVVISDEIWILERP